MQIDDKLLDELLAEAAQSPRLRMNRDLRNTPADQSQRMLNALLPGTVLPIHRHEETSETVVIMRGKMDEVFYDGEHGSEIARFTLDVRLGHYGMSIPRGMWHSVEVHEPTVIVEMKDGPYVPR
ncbi:MAG: WbuC family cupin fold metalloprotein [Bacteroidaceae bacterium]|jgi:cupin fold WbuC family metalloprotein|nr:WbuC family cupin fold metalloprotein [Bacteroidaceae bacterium]MBQ7987964.1 WbuC family cupin fold metalloprotein [Bacteroidaceae bacterium]